MTRSDSLNAKGSLLRFQVVAFALLVVCIGSQSPIVCYAQSADDDKLALLRIDAENYFEKDVSPFLKTYCIDCHQNKRPTEAGISFTPSFRDPGHAAFTQIWKKAAARVKAHDMPPDGMEQPTEDERRMFVRWLSKVKYLSHKDPGPFVIRRLTKMEYGNTLRDLFGVDPSIADELPDEVSGEGYLNSISPLQMEQYLSIANKVLEQVLTPDNQLPKVLQQRLLGGLHFDETGNPENARNVAKLVAHKAFRRSASARELDVLLQVYDLAIENKTKHPRAIRLMLKAILVSPQFLFITPAPISSTANIVPLDDHHLASRLSYLLWATMPDDELMDCAASGKLQEPYVLRTQITRLLSSPRSRALFDGFGAQWLGVGDLQEKPFDPQKYPQMTDAMRQAMYDEVRLVFEEVIRQNRDVISLIDCDFTFLNEDLATIYSLDKAVSGTEMRKITLSNSNRGGILGMPGVLAATSFPNRTSPVKRGVWVLERVLGDHVPSAPPDIPALEAQEEESIEGLTLRERTELHRTDPVCANCHSILDPIGFGLENFDAIGRWREVDESGQAIVASGDLPGDKRFSSPKELKSIIAERKADFARNFVEKLLAYALCRRLEGYDQIIVDDLMRTISTEGYRMQSIISAVVSSYPFTHRRIQEGKSLK